MGQPRLQKVALSSQVMEVVARGGIEPPTRGFSVRSATKTCYCLSVLRSVLKNVLDSQDAIFAL
jgi:hypothetical protein